MKLRLVITIISLFYIQQLLSQDNLPEIVPPSPTAYELGKFGQIPVGMFTGTPNVNIPFYDYKTNNITVPISLSYSNNGIKVDQLSSNVGLGWNLNIGGVITRIVRDKSDENRELLYPEEDIHQPGGINSPMGIDFFHLAGQAQNDSETDMFMYNFQGFSGGFVFSPKGGVVMVPYKDLLINTYQEGSYSGFKVTDSSGIIYIFIDSEVNRSVISGGGVSHPEPEYHTTAWYLSRIIHPKGDVVNFLYENKSYSYDLSVSESITVPTPLYQSGCNGSSGTGPGYTKKTINNELLISGKQLVEINSDNQKDGRVSLNSNIFHPVVSNYRMVSNISVLDDSENIIEKLDLDYLSTSNGRIFLKNIIFKDPLKKYSLDYFDPEGLINRLSKAQDYWGYYNGKVNNSNYFPNPQTLEFMPPELSALNIGADKSINPQFTEKGLLQRIHYPTKGYNEFKYEPNSYFSEETIYPSKQYISVVAETGEFDHGNSFDAISTTSTILFNHKASFVAYASFNSRECSEDLLKSKSTITITDNQTGLNVNILIKTQQGYSVIGKSVTVSYNSPNNQFFVDLVQGHSYTIRLHPAFSCVNTDLIFQYYQDSPTTQFTNILSGGMRIKEITSKDSNDTLENTMRYYYGKKESLNESSGVPGKVGYFLSKQTKHIACGVVICGYIEQYYTSLNSTSLRPLFNSSSNGSTYYKYVTVSHGGDEFENGGEENEFIINEDYPGNPLKGDAIESAVWVNSGWSNGLLKKQTIFKKSISDELVLVKQTINNYLQDNRYFNKVYGYAINKKFDYVCAPPDLTRNCTKADITKQYSIRRCLTNHKHWLGSTSGNNNQGWECTAPGHNNQTLNLPSPCYGKSEGYLVTYPNYLNNLDITEYTTNSYWYYLNQKIELQYDLNGLNPLEKITDYHYDNPDHLQLTREKFSTSKGYSSITKTYYPSDVLSISSLGNDNLDTAEISAIETLVSQHRIAEPIQINTYEDSDSDGKEEPNELLSSLRTNYKDWGQELILPEYIQSFKGVYSNSNKLQNKIQFVDYLNNGKVREISQNDGRHIVYIYGYKEKYPVAKIENSTYSAVASTLTSAELTNIQEGNYDKSVMILKLNKIRTSLSNAMVTTYTYDPLIGVTSITDPKGYTTYYDYDDFNRLKQIKDAEGNILSENEYNYKQ